MLWKNARRTLISLAALLCATAVSSAAQDQGEGSLGERIRAKDAELQRLREEISAERKKIEEVERKEKDIAGYLAKLDREEKLTNRLLRGISEKEDMLVQQVQRLREDLDYSEKVFDGRRVILAKRLREMYKSGPQYTWQELLQADDFGDLLQRYKFLSAIAERDANLVEEVRQRKTDIARREANLTESLAQATSARREKERELARLKANEQKRKKTLAELKTSKGAHQKRIEQLARAERDLLAIIETFEKERTTGAPEAWEASAGKDFPALKGRMRSPVEGRQVRGFGESKHPEFGTVTFNPGVDIEARAGSPVRAVARGKVEYASLLPGFGNCIIIAHGQGYYTLYAHTSKIFVKKDAMVNAGDVVAEAGGASAETGSAFHFEIRKSKKALDPADWLGK
ncbi:MAG: peptidoglycan DD-metalloendopeptidase family protein [Candidatus Krumholzibacteria bacterium]|nr:peptidoglycan DD-metalloendopeptidase family protein [Candidatus Krumholzibacteria bacterium]